MSVNIGSALGYLDLNTEGFSRGLTTSLSAIQGFRNGTNNLSGVLKTVGGGIESLGKGMTTKLTLPVAAAGTAIVATSAKFEAGMSKVSAISGATGGDLEQLKQKAMEMGAKTKFSASEAADAFSYMAMAGWKTEDMMSGIDGIMNLAAASGEDLALTSDIVTDALTAFGLSAQDSSHFADVLAATSSNANTNVSLLGESFKYCAPACGAMKYSAEDASIALGLMANSGIKGSQAGNTLKNAIVNMVKPTDNMQIVMDKLGLSLTDSQGNMLSLREVLVQLREKFNGLSEEEKANAAATLFGKESMSGMLAVINASDADFNKLAGAINNADGSAEKMAETMNDNLSGQITILKSTLETLCLQLGEILVPIVKDVVQHIQNFVTWLTSLDENTQRIIVVVSLILAAIGPILVIVGKLIFSVGIMMELFFEVSEAVSAAGGAFAVLTNPIALAIAAIVAIVGYLTFLYNTNEKVRDAMNSAWERIKEGISVAWEKIQPPLQRLGEAFQKLVEVLQPLLELIGGALIAQFAQLVGVFNGAIQALGSVIDMIANVVNFVAEVVAGVFDLLTGDIDGAKEHFGNAIEEIKNFFINGFNAIGEFISGFFDGFLGTFQTVFDSLGMNVDLSLSNVINAITTWASNLYQSACDSANSFIDGFVSFFSNLPQNIEQFINQVIEDISTWASNMAESARQAGSDFINGVVEFFNQLPERIGYFIGYALGTVVQWAIEMPQKAAEMGTNFLNAVVQFFTQLPGKIQEFLTTAVNNTITWANDMKAKATETGTNFINSIVQFFTQLPGKVQQFLTNTINTVTSFASNMGAKATEAASKFSTNIVSGLQKIPSQVGSIGRNIVQGLWNGISGAVGWIKSKVQGFAKGILDGMKSALDIHSPSRLFRDEVGKNIALGVAIGIENETNYVASSAEKLSVAAYNRALSQSDSFKELGQNYANNLKQGIENRQNLVIESVKKTVDNSVAAFAAQNESKKSEYKAAGDNLVKAYTDAIKKGTSDAIKVITDNITEISDKFQKEYDDLVKQQENMKNKLADYGELFKIDEDGDVTLSNINRQTRAIKDYASMLQELKDRGVSAEFLGKISELDVEKGSKVLEKLLSMNDERFNQYVTAWETKQQVANQLSQQFYATQLTTLENDFVNKINGAMTNVPATMQTIGQQTMTGFMNGMDSEMSNLIEKSSDIAESVLEEFRKAFDIHSPSKKAAELGGFVVQGFGQGMEEESDTLVNPIQEIMKSIFDLGQDVYKSESFIDVFLKVKDIAIQIREEFNAIFGSDFSQLALAGNIGESIANATAIQQQDVQREKEQKENEKNNEPTIIKKEVNMNIENFHNHRTEDIQEIAEELNDYLNDKTV